MLFIINCFDAPKALAKRKELRPLHLAHLASVEASILTAGPKLDANANPIGSLLIIDFGDRSQAEEFAAADPYNRNGVFRKVEITPYKKVF